MLPTFPSADAVRGEVRLSRGAVRLWALLHRLACDVARQREYVAVVDQVVFHLPAVTVAGVLDYHPDHVARLGRELERAALLEFGGHAQTVLGRNMYDGCLFAVKTKPTAEPPRIRADEWRHNWRPGFTADVLGKTGAAAELSELKTAQADYELKYQTAKARAAVPVGVSPPALSSSDSPNPAGLRAVIEALPGLWSAHATQRAREVGRLASALCAALSEPERRRYWCKVLWSAFKATQEGRTGGLQALGAQISRLAGDLDDKAPWRNPGSILAARLRTA